MFSQRRAWCLAFASFCLTFFVGIATVSAEDAAASDGNGKTAKVIDPHLLKLWTGVVEFRKACAFQGESGWNRFVDRTVRHQLADLGPQLWGDDSDDGWSYFFSLALFDIGRPTTAAPVVGFFHPWCDVWVLTEWRIDDEARIANVEIVTGEWLRRRGQPPFDLRPDWLRRDGFRVEQLARATVESIQAFDRIMLDKTPWRGALRLADDPDPAIAEMRDVDHDVAALLLTTGCLRYGELASGDPDPEQPLLEHVSSMMQQFLAAGRKGTLGEIVASAKGTEPATAKIVRDLPKQLFHYLSPVYWVADQKRGIAFLVPSTNPDYCVAITGDWAGDEMHVSRVDIVSFPASFNAVMKTERKKDAK